MIQRRDLLAAALLAASFGAVPVSAADADDPWTWVVKVSNDILDAIRADDKLHSGDAEALRALQSLLVAPFGDLGLMAREEDVGHAPAFVFGRAGVIRCGKQMILKRIGEGALLVADGSGDEAHQGVGDDDGGQLAAGEHIVADRYLFGDQMLAHAIVYHFIVAAKYDYIVEQ